MTTALSDNYDSLGADELRRLLREKQGVVVQVISENQTAVTMRLRAENAQREAERKMELMAAKLQAAQREVEKLSAQHDSALRFATTMYEKLVHLSSVNKKPKDVKKVVELFHRSMEEVSRITASSKINEMDFVNKVFAAAERRVFGSMGEKKPVTDPSAFVERSLQKKNGKEQEHAAEDPSQG